MKVRINRTPLPLGFTSAEEYLDLYLESSFRDHLFGRLTASLPRGFGMDAYRPIFTGGQSLSAMLNRAEYLVVCPTEVEEAEEKVARFLASDSLPVVRQKKDRTVDIRPSVLSLSTESVGGQQHYRYTLVLGEPNVAKPLEVLSLATGLAADQVLTAHVRRTRLFATRGGREYSPLDLA